ncbi:Protease [hydrothermal vent metagenome]|uniref:Protease n=1 Tax=hydrothermal vent metagenome TaxID=652676 RepID=A0A1W1E957_9ZZZZ
MIRFLTILSLIFLIGCNKSTTSIDNNDSNTSFLVSDEPYYYQQWYLDRNDTFYIENDIDANASIQLGEYRYYYMGRGIKVAIIDDGLDMKHEDLKGAILHTFDIATNSTNVNHTDSEDFHGTAVTGIIAARKNDKGILGVAAQSQILFLKYKERMSDSDLIELFKKAQEWGADVINCSWGTYDVSESVKEVIQDLATNGRGGRGIPIVFAAGNDDQDMGNDESAIDEVIAVGASGKDNHRTWYSNYGEHLDVLAPGGYYIGIATLDDTGSNGAGTLDENYLLAEDENAFIGTSAAAPIVTGVIALMLEKNPNLTRKEIETILHNTSDKIGDREYIDGFNEYYGYGKINVSKIMSRLDI